MENYKELLKSPHWQRKRLQIMERAGFKCEWCGDTESQLHIHHRIYRKNCKPWDYEPEVLLCVCSDCHDSLHQFQFAITEAIAALPLEKLDKLADFMAELIEIKK